MTDRRQNRYQQTLDHIAALAAQEGDPLLRPAERLAVTAVELLPLPRPSFDYPYAYDGDDMENYALANVAHTTAQLQAENERLREALALLPDEIDMVEHNQDEGPRMFCCGRKVTLSRHHGLIPIHDEGCWYARMRALRALRDHYQEDRND